MLDSPGSGKPMWITVVEVEVVSGIWLGLMQLLAFEE